ncbi:MAG: glycosyltransferase [Alphaproteobacteria bacterium]|nr:glycosyltransferase [Alphaproteobacteria bacterium]
MNQSANDFLTDECCQAGKGKRLCLVSDSRATVSPTADQFARWLVKDGWDVTLLDLAPFQMSASDKPYAVVLLAGAFQERNNYAPTQSLCAYHWLKENVSDVIIFQHGFGSGYFCCVAKELGLAFATTTLVAMADDPYFCWLEESRRFPSFDSFRTDSEIDYFERHTIAKADGLLITRSQTLDWMREAGWLVDGVRPALLGADAGQPIGKWLTQIKAKTKVPQNDVPFISVCVTASSNVRHLRELLVSLRDQTNYNFELIVVDPLEAQADIDAVRDEFLLAFGERSLLWIKRAGADVGLLRNEAAQRASGSYVYFLDEDDVVLPAAIEVLQNCLCFASVDILTAVAGKHTNCDNTITAVARFPAQAHPDKASIAVGWIYYGANIATGVAVNVVGNECSLFRKDVFLALGGFAPGAGDAGYRLLLDAVNRDYKIHVMPEVLAMNRRDKNGRILWNENRFKDDIATLAALANFLPVDLRSILLPFRSFNNERKTLTRFPQATQKDLNCVAMPPTAFAPSCIDANAIVRVVLCADDGFLKQASVALASLLCSMTSKIEVYLITTMGEANIARISAVAEHFGCALKVIAVDREREEKLPASTMWGKNSTAPYWRLWLPDYLPELDRVIYLDCDLIVRRDLMELWSFDLGTQFVAACRDPIGFDVPGLAQDCGGDYFNTGVLLINLAQWRKEQISAKALAVAADFEAQNYSYQFHEQSPLNKAINGRWTVISPTWNYNDDICNKAAYFNLDANDLAQISEDPAIYHFRTNKKPWFPDFPVGMPYGREYRVYEKLVSKLLGE